MRLILPIVLSAAIAAPAIAKPPLRDVAAIDNGLMSVAIADEIRKKCDGISARMVRALSTLEGLKSEARGLGYSNDEIEDYVTSKSEKRRMRAKATAYLASKGVSADSTSQLCAFGKSEISKGSSIGRLLR